MGVTIIFFFKKKEIIRPFPIKNKIRWKENRLG